MPWKRFLLRCFGAKIAATANVYASARVFMPWNLVMKDHACLASGVDCYNAALVEVGVNATVSQRCFLCTASHDISSPCHEQTEMPIRIADRAWVAAEAFVGPGVTVGRGAVVGACRRVQGCSAVDCRRRQSCCLLEEKGDNRR